MSDFVILGTNTVDCECVLRFGDFVVRHYHHAREGRPRWREELRARVDFSLMHPDLGRRYGINPVLFFRDFTTVSHFVEGEPATLVECEWFQRLLWQNECGYIGDVSPTNLIRTPDQRLVLIDFWYDLDRAKPLPPHTVGPGVPGGTV